MAAGSLWMLHYCFVEWSHKGGVTVSLHNMAGLWCSSVTCSISQLPDGCQTGWCLGARCGAAGYTL